MNRLVWALTILTVLTLGCNGRRPGTDPGDPLARWERVAEYVERGVRVARAVLPQFVDDPETLADIQRYLEIAEGAAKEMRAVLALVRAGTAPERDLQEIQRRAYDALDKLIELIGVIRTETSTPEMAEYFEWRAQTRP